MYLLLHTADIKQLPKNTPREIIAKIHELTETLDNLYGKTRAFGEDGGYILYVPKDKDYKQSLNEVDIDLEEDTPELIDVVHTSQGDFLNILYLFNNEYGVNVIICKDNVPKSILSEL